ncbi:hypothetical protein CFOL_v3_26494 [Cephalotus follicularis]|uniref:C2H2-type domain-containing protein n=1 Tax=Cephalotus follicularis TaxID=3775 RepID=A0A1Q3CSK1_CEPFO|nr:hypothetical protein CFOL_v3_26494 [Cephalotus follicularis]
MDVEESGVGEEVEGSGEGSPRRKRERADDGEGSGTGEPRPRRRGEISVPENMEPICVMCHKKFGSWKAVFGHLRAHPRPWKGAFPPPVFKRDDSSEGKPVSAEQLVPTLLQIAQETLQKVNEISHGPSSSSAGAGVGPSSSSSSYMRRGGLRIFHINEGESSFKDPGFDLNITPPENDEGDDDDNTA